MRSKDADDFERSFRDRLVSGAFLVALRLRAFGLVEIDAPFRAGAEDAEGQQRFDVIGRADIKVSESALPIDLVDFALGLLEIRQIDRSDLLFLGGVL